MHEESVLLSLTRGRRNETPQLSGFLKSLSFVFPIRHRLQDFPALLFLFRISMSQFASFFSLPVQNATVVLILKQ
jgi:hypothetical protein